MSVPHKEIFVRVHIPFTLAVELGLKFAGTYNLPSSDVLHAMLRGDDRKTLAEALVKALGNGDGLCLLLTRALVEQADTVLRARTDCRGQRVHTGMGVMDALQCYTTADGDLYSRDYRMPMGYAMAMCLIEALRSESFAGLITRPALLARLFDGLPHVAFNEPK